MSNKVNYSTKLEKENVIWFTSFLVSSVYNLQTPLWKTSLRWLQMQPPSSLSCSRNNIFLSYSQYSHSLLRLYFIQKIQIYLLHFGTTLRGQEKFWIEFCNDLKKVFLIGILGTWLMDCKSFDFSLWKLEFRDMHEGDFKKIVSC
jgi:hypothetical protein